jgi:hypothetical protein
LPDAQLADIWAGNECEKGIVVWKSPSCFVHDEPSLSNAQFLKQTLRGFLKVDHNFSHVGLIIDSVLRHQFSSSVRHHNPDALVVNLKRLSSPRAQDI